MFQFQYGAIKSQPEGLTAQETSGFNSNMVRLRENPDGTHRGLINQFQFQYGAIKRKLPNIFFIVVFLVSIPIWCD